MTSLLETPHLTTPHLMNPRRDVSVAPMRPGHVPTASGLDRSRPTQLSELGTIDLPSLVAAGELQTRMDRKYLVPESLVPDLLGQFRDSALVLQIDRHRRFGYRTVYFDTTDAASYLATTRRRRLRYKVRTRIYLDSGDCFLEVKTKDGRGRTVKTRTPYPLRDADRLTDEARAFLVGELAARVADPAADVARLTPALSTHYQRATLFLPDDAARVTIDTDLVARERGGRVLRLSGQAIVETKSGRAASAMDRALWRVGHRPIKVSKFATCLAALDPSLPATKWRPALRRLQGGSTPPEAA